MKPVRWKILLFSLLAYALVEGFILAGLWAISEFRGIRYDPRQAELSDVQRAKLERFLERDGIGHSSFDPILGWTNNSSKANSDGMRDDQEYETTPPDDQIRIAAFGDSFTFGSDVELHESWAKQLVAIDPQLQLLNYGVPAYGMDQAYLRYLQQGKRYHPDIVFIGYLSENLGRHVNVFRPFYSTAYGKEIFTKPRFRLEGGELQLLDNPISTRADQMRLLEADSEVLAEIGANDYHYQSGYDPGGFDFLPSVRFLKIVGSILRREMIRPIFTRDGMYADESEAFNVTVALFDSFYADVLEMGALPVIVIFSDVVDQYRNRRHKPRKYQPLLDVLRIKGYRVIDTLVALEAVESKYSVDELAVEWGHFSPIASRVAAEYMSSRLETWGLKDSSMVQASVLAECERLGIEGCSPR